MRRASQQRQPQQAQPRREEVLVLRDQSPRPGMPKKKQQDFFRRMLEHRARSLLGKLRKHHPEIFEDRKHEFNGEARDYWHYGYLAALKDFRTLVKRGKWPLEAYNPNNHLDFPEED